MEGSQQAKNRITILSSNSITGHIAKEKKSTNLKIHMHLHSSIHSGVSYNSQNMEVT